MTGAQIPQKQNSGAPEKCMYDANALVKRYISLPSPEGEEGKTVLLAGLIRLFASLADQEEVRLAYPEIRPLFDKVCRSLDHGDPEAVEDELTRIYAYLHGKDKEYEPAERREMDAWGGYWCHAGGLSPLYRAAPYINERTRLADYGAGNGLQGLLFQYLYPHAKTTQIELSGPMIEQGKRLQAWMGIPPTKVAWVHKNVLEVPPTDFDFLYIYRPVRPEGAGRIFYERFAERLETVEHPVTIFSIADCLKDFLGKKFRVFYNDGQLTCFRSG
jgi:hypothetical protein